MAFQVEKFDKSLFIVLALSAKYIGDADGKYLSRQLIIDTDGGRPLAFKVKQFVLEMDCQCWKHFQLYFLYIKPIQQLLGNWWRYLAQSIYSALV